MSGPKRLTPTELRAYRGGARGFLDGLSVTKTLKRLGLERGGYPGDENFAAREGYVDMEKHMARQLEVQEYAACHKVAETEGR